MIGNILSILVAILILLMAVTMAGAFFGFLIVAGMMLWDFIAGIFNHFHVKRFSRRNREQDQ